MSLSQSHSRRHTFLDGSVGAGAAYGYGTKLTALPQKGGDVGESDSVHQLAESVEREGSLGSDSEYHLHLTHGGHNTTVISALAAQEQSVDGGSGKNECVGLAIKSCAAVDVVSAMVRRVQ